MHHVMPTGIAAALRAYNIPYAALPNGSTGYLSITLTTSATHSGLWIGQRTKLGAVEPILDGSVYFNASNQLVINGLTSTAVFRDPTAAYTVFWNASGAWVKGVAVTGTGSYATASIVNPRLFFNGTNYSNAYCGKFVFWNGTSESEPNGYATDSATSQEIPKAPTGTPHTHLEFLNSGAMGTNSGTGGNWTVNGTVTQVESTPTNVYSVGNPLYNNSFTYTNGNKTASIGAAWNICAPTLKQPETTKIYAEVVNGVATTGSISFCIGASLATVAPANSHSASNCWGFFSTSGGFLYSNGPLAASGLAVAVAGEVFQLALDPDTYRVWVGRANVFYNSTGGLTGDPAAGTNPTFQLTAGQFADLYMSISIYANNVTWRISEDEWTLTCPTGFKSLCTDNLPARSPKVPSTPQTGSFTGNASADGPFVNLGMAPDKAGVSTINGNTITWGTHADACATGFKLRTSSASYNASGANTYSVAVAAYSGGSNVPPANAMSNP